MPRTRREATKKEKKGEKVKKVSKLFEYFFFILFLNYSTSLCLQLQLTATIIVAVDCYGCS